MADVKRIGLVTDFGSGSAYTGQMLLRLGRLAPQLAVVDLISDLPPFRPDLAAYLLPAIARDVPRDTLFLCVVDPGVGGARGAIALEADGRRYVGPDNGLLAMTVRRSSEARIHKLTWRPEKLSESFHGRDLFCPLAAMFACDNLPESVPMDPESLVGSDWPDDLTKVIYADRYGNLITGIRASALTKQTVIQAAGRDIVYARTFCEVAPGMAFWYENSFGLVELAVNQGRAGSDLDMRAGDPVGVSGPRR
jgi:S-adenosylmethionine hydrolase